MIDELYTNYPFYGSRRMTVSLQKKGYDIGRKKVSTLMRKMGIEAIYPKPNLSKKHSGHKIFPYLLRGAVIKGPNHVWSSDITYIKLRRGFVYLVAFIDWYSRYILSWGLSNSLSSDFCIEAFQAALESIGDVPSICNFDQGSQFTCSSFVNNVLSSGSKISMDGKGRALDNVFIERFWRSLKYEEVYLNEYRTVEDAYAGISKYFEFYNSKRVHQALGYKTPQEIYFAV